MLRPIFILMIIKIFLICFVSMSLSTIYQYQHFQMKKLYHAEFDRIILFLEHLLLLLRLTRVSHVRLAATPERAAPRAPPSLGFSRRECWSGLPFPSPTHACWVASIVSDSGRSYGQQPTRLLHPQDSPGKNTGVGCHFLLHLKHLGRGTTFHFHALKKEMATHSTVLAWRIPRTVEPGGLPSMGPHRVGHKWSDLATEAAHHYLS